MLDPKVTTILRAAEAGRANLDSNLLKGWRGFQQLKQLRLPPPEGASGVRQAAEALVASINEHGEAPAGWQQDAHDSVQAAERHQAAARVLDAAVALAERTLEEQVHAAVPGAVAWLQASVDGLVTSTRKLLKGGLKGIDPLNADKVLQAGDAARSAFLELKAHGAELEHLRGTWRILLAVDGDVEPGLADLYGVVADVAERWPHLKSHDVMPWPAEGSELLVWSIREAARLWLPTRSQLREGREAARQARAASPERSVEHAVWESQPAGGR